MDTAAELLASHGLQGRVALVSGGSGNLGAACCRDLARIGATVVAGYHTNEPAARKLAEEIQEAGGDCLPVRADLATPEGPQALVDAAVEKFGRFDVCVAAAGLRTRRMALATDAAEVSRLTAANYHGVVNLAKAALRPMLRARYGRIVVFGSTAGVHGLPGHSAYAGTKAALQAWASSVAGEVGGRGITVNVVAPGAIRADEMDFHTDAERELVLKFIGAGRFGEPTEVAAVVSFLSSRAASYVNGATILVDGGARF